MSRPNSHDDAYVAIQRMRIAGLPQGYRILSSTAEYASNESVVAAQTRPEGPKTEPPTASESWKILYAIALACLLYCAPRCVDRPYLAGVSQSLGSSAF